MPVIRTGETEYDKELARWDRPKSQGGMRPDTFQAFPKMLYRAIKLATGKVVSYEFNPATGEPYAGTFLAVGDETEERRQRDQGYRETPAEALAHFEAVEQEIARAAAERHHTDQRLSEKARAEAAAADAATSEHVADIPRKRGKE